MEIVSTTKRPPAGLGVLSRIWRVLIRQLQPPTRLLDAGHALTAGVIDRVYDPESLLDKCLAYA